jgi:predicted MFS family arabinose efflux permease
MTQAPLWTRDFILVSMINFLLVLIFYLLVVVIGLYAVRELQASVSQSGLVVGIFVIGVMAGRLTIGPFLDRVGRRRSMLLGLCLAVVSSLFYFVEAGLGFLIAIRFLHGFALGLAATSVATMIAQMIPAARRSEGIGYFSMSSSLSTAIGPFIGIYMMQHAQFELVFGLCCLLGVIAVVAAMTIKVPELNHQEHRQAQQPAGQLRSPRFLRAGLLEPRVIPICSVIFFCGLAYSGVLSYLSVYAVERNLNEAASFFFLVYAISILLSRPFSGRLMDNHGANIIMYPAFLLFTLGLMTMGFANASLTLLIAASLIGLGFGNIQSCGQAIAIKLVEPSRFGLATSTYFIFFEAGLGFGPFLLGLLIDFTGYGNLYFSLAVLLLLCMLAYYFVHGRYDNKGSHAAAI